MHGRQNRTAPDNKIYQMSHINQAPRTGTFGCCMYDIQLEHQRAKTTPLLRLIQDMKGFVEDDVIDAISKELDFRIAYPCHKTVLCERVRVSEDS